MTEDAHKDWDAAQNAIADALAELSALYASVPSELETVPTMNRILMAMESLETAKDQLAAARARMPETETGR